MDTPTHILTGHADAVLELQWLGKERLATLSKDRTLRLWFINDQLKFHLGGELVSSETGMATESGLQRLPISPSVTIAANVSLTPTSTPSSSIPPSSGGKLSINKNLEDHEGAKGTTPQQGYSEKKGDPTMSLPTMRSPFGGVDGLGGGSMLSGSPSTHSLLSVSSSMSSLSNNNSIFQPLGGHSLAKEFAQLRTETFTNLEIETVREERDFPLFY